ncbi:MAG: 16S rRNA (guanine(527)-N(7))-methyltransferase RsmG [candidate division SR1 bacterium]|nr:16S rRNA (guanine(527)-N(7))-methyltransferase RsmG [candidate division SR1 bacterium]
MEIKRKALIDQFISINSHTNLSAIRDPEGIQVKHIQDSLEINKVLVLKPGLTLCDVGTGGGFPLLPIAINNPELQCTGIDSTRKKIDAINEMITNLKIPNVKALRTRAEDHKEQYDYVTARAVGYIDKLLPQVHHLIKKGGRLILYKQFTPEESQDIGHFGKRYRFVVQKKHKYQLFEGDIQRIIYVLKKI